MSPVTIIKEKGNRAISVRMYNVGFGDCFLIRIPTSKGERRVLVDCGYHTKGQGKFNDKELIHQLKDDLKGDGLDVVIASHRHQDHISGFGETELWADIAVEEVWLPFTAQEGSGSGPEEPALAAWNRLLLDVPNMVDEEGNLIGAAAAAMNARSAEEQAAAAFLLWNARTNAPGIDNLLRGMKNARGVRGPRRFLPDHGKDVPYDFESPALPEVRVHVLGPPREPKMRRKRSVPVGWGISGAGSGLPGEEGTTGSPFGPQWIVPRTELPERRPFQEKSLKKIAEFNVDLLAVARSVDGFLNGESLVLVLELGSAKLLLTGDAEVGSWENILATPRALEVASGATFLKVGHHGSHNATPRIFIKEHLSRNTPAMISTQQGTGKWRTGIPLNELIEDFASRKMPVARSDEAVKENKLFSQDPQARWIDCTIPC